MRKYKNKLQFYFCPTNIPRMLANLKFWTKIAIHPITLSLSADIRWIFVTTHDLSTRLKIYLWIYLLIRESPQTSTLSHKISLFENGYVQIQYII